MIAGPPAVLRYCAACGYQAWRENYPCNRCGGVEPRTYVAVDALLSDEAVEWACVAFFPGSVGSETPLGGLTDEWREWMRNALAAASQTAYPLP